MKKIGIIGIPGSWSSEALAEAVYERTGYSVVIDISKAECDLSQNRVICNGEDLSSFDALIIKKVGLNYSPHLLDRLEILYYLSASGVRIFSKPERIITLLDRLSCTTRLAAAGIPMPPTFITEETEKAVTAIETFGKSILKPLYSTKARGMMVVEKGENLKDKLERFRNEGNQLFYIQKMIKIPERDLGLSFLGGQYVATYARVKSKDAWNTTTNSGGKYQPHEPTPEMIKLAWKAQNIFKLDFTCVDMVLTDDGPMIFEVSAFGGFRGLKDANGIDAASRYADYVLSHLHEDTE